MNVSFSFKNCACAPWRQFYLLLVPPNVPQNSSWRQGDLLFNQILNLDQVDLVRSAGRTGFQLSQCGEKFNRKVLLHAVRFRSSSPGLDLGRANTHLLIPSVSLVTPEQQHICKLAIADSTYIRGRASNLLPSRPRPAPTAVEGSGGESCCSTPTRPQLTWETTPHHTKR